MDTAKELIRLRRELVEALQEADQADSTATSATKAYDSALATWEAANPELVKAKNEALSRKTELKKQIEALRDEAKKILITRKFTTLPTGFTQSRTKVVKYDKQGFFVQALQFFPFLLELNEAAVKDFFIAAAKEQKDGALIVPESIRRFVNVEVVFEIAAEISNATLSKLVLEDEPAVEPEDTEPLNPPEIHTPIRVTDEWTAPDNFVAILTAPELPAIEDYSSEGESLPMGKPFNEDKTWKNQSLWDKNEAQPKRELAGFAVPATGDIDF